MLYRIIKENQNKIFWTIGQFEFKYFGGSDVVNKLLDFEQTMAAQIPIPMYFPLKYLQSLVSCRNNS